MSKSLIKNEIEIEDLKYEDIEECYEMNMKIFAEDRKIEEIKEAFRKEAHSFYEKMGYDQNDSKAFVKYL